MKNLMFKHLRTLKKIVYHVFGFTLLPTKYMNNIYQFFYTKVHSP